MAEATQSKHRALLITGIALSAIGVVPLALSFVSMSALRRDVAKLSGTTTGQGTYVAPLAAPRPEPADVDDADWTAFQDVGRDLSAVQGALSKRFRLAGTFSMYTTQGSYYRKAILDLLEHGKQRIVAEGDALEELEIVSILRDRVVVRDEAGREIEIWQSTDVASSQQGSGDNTRPDKSSIDADALAAFNGKYHGKNRWSFERHTLLRYYKTLHDNPDRLVRVFDSMRPVRNYENNIEGYKLAVEGEREFFAAVGLSDGDIVRSVNDVRMTNRRRAEFFLKNFALGRNTAFVIDVERNGETERRFYQIK